jgi:hypothetical protein
MGYLSDNRMYCLIQYTILISNSWFWRIFLAVVFVGAKENVINPSFYEKWCVHSQAIIFEAEDLLDVINPIIVTNLLEHGTKYR